VFLNSGRTQKSRKLKVKSTAEAEGGKRGGKGVNKKRKQRGMRRKNCKKMPARKNIYDLCKTKEREKTGNSRKGTTKKRGRCMTKASGHLGQGSTSGVKVTNDKKKT